MNKWLFIFLFASCFSKAQDVVIKPQSDNPLEIGRDFELSFPENNNEYLATQWSKGKLFYANGTSKTYDSLNFNRYLDIIEVAINNKVLTLKPMGLAGALIYNSEKLGFVLIAAKVDIETRFLLTNSVGKYLFASYLTADKIEDSRGFRTDELRFVPKKEKEAIINEFFALFKEGKWEKFKLNKSALSKLFKLDKKKLQSIAATYNLNLNDKTGLIVTFQVLNKE